MTYATYDLTPHTQLSIRGTTGTHPDSKFVFGVYIGSQEHYAEDFGMATMPDMHAYDDMDWSEAVKMAKWILEQDEWIRKDRKEQYTESNPNDWPKEVDE